MKCFWRKDYSAIRSTWISMEGGIFRSMLSSKRRCFSGWVVLTHITSSYLREFYFDVTWLPSRSDFREILFQGSLTYCNLKIGATARVSTKKHVASTDSKGTFSSAIEWILSRLFCSLLLELSKGCFNMRCSSHPPRIRKGGPSIRRGVNLESTSS